MTRLLVVTGEASGDAWAARIVEGLGVPAFGLGGARLEASGAELVADLRDFSAMGLVPAARRAPDLLRAAYRLMRALRSRRPGAALLVGFSEVNARLAPWLRARGTRVLWLAPPQVWAWRPSRVSTLAGAAHRFALVLPFEEALWRGAGAPAEYVGHPALERGAARRGVEPAKEGEPRLVLLPGSRPHEVRAHLPPLLSTVHILRRRGDVLGATVVFAESLDVRTRAWAEGAAAAARVTVTPHLGDALAGAHVAVVASGTATLECAAHGVPPVIVYRTDRVTYAAARRLVRVPHIGLPNLILGRGAFPELVQGAVTPPAIARATRDVLRDGRARRADCAEVRARLTEPLDDRSPSDRVAAMLAPWLP